MRMWGGGARNAVVSVEADVTLDALLAPYQPLAMRAAACPIDPRLTAREAAALLAALQPDCVVLPARLARSGAVALPPDAVCRVEHVGEGRGSVLLPVPPFRRGLLAPPLASRVASLQPLSGGGDGQHSHAAVASGGMAPLRARVALRDHVLLVAAAAEGKEGGDGGPFGSRGGRGGLLCGRVQVAELVQRLTASGLACSALEPGDAAGEFTLRLAQEGGGTAVLTLGAQGTLVAASDPGLRAVLRDVLVAGLAAL